MLRVVESFCAVPVVLVRRIVMENARAMRIDPVIRVIDPWLPKGAIRLLLWKCDIVLELVERS